MCNKLSGKFLREMLGFESVERILKQNTQVLGKKHFLSYDVDSVFGCDRKINFYIDGKDLAEHKERRRI